MTCVCVSTFTMKSINFGRDSGSNSGTKSLVVYCNCIVIIHDDNIEQDCIIDV